jgi:hypothetical protein
MKRQIQNWDPEIAELRSFFNQAVIPSGPIKLSVCETIIDTDLFIKSHFNTLVRHSGNETYRSHLIRLNEFASLLEVK